MSNYRTMGEIEEVDDYVNILFDEYAESGDTASLMSSLRVVCRVKGVSKIAEVSGLSRKGVQKALSENGNPQFGTVNAILHAMGYRLTPTKTTRTIPRALNIKGSVLPSTLMHRILLRYLLTWICNL